MKNEIAQLIGDAGWAIRCATNSDAFYRLICRGVGYRSPDARIVLRQDNTRSKDRWRTKQQQI